MKILKNIGTSVILSGVNPSVKKDLDKNRITFLVGKANIFDAFDKAVNKAEELINEKR